MTTDQQESARIEQAKVAFLIRYNPKHSEAIALTSGLKAAAQHNPLYKPEVARRPIQRRWKDLLSSRIGQYEDPVSIDSYEEDVWRLRRTMNLSFTDSFREPGFRVSHAQKSLSVFLKHLWCMNRIVEPPACPVDRVVLQKVTHGPPGTWTRVDSLAEHRELFARIRSAAEAEGRSVAQWELLTFAP